MYRAKNDNIQAFKQIKCPKCNNLVTIIFESLDGPILRVGGLDTPVPFRKELEDNYMPKDRLKRKINKLMSY